MCKDFILGLYLMSKVIAHTTIHDLLDASTTIKDYFITLTVAFITMKYKQRIKLQRQRFLVQRYLIFFLRILNQAPIWRQLAAFSPSFYTAVIVLKQKNKTNKQKNK